MNDVIYENECTHDELLGAFCTHAFLLFSRVEASYRASALGAGITKVRVLFISWRIGTARNFLHNLSIRDGSILETSGVSLLRRYKRV